MSLKICISGLTATGKTSIAAYLVRTLNAKYVSASQVLGELYQAQAHVSGLLGPERDFWLSSTGKDVLAQRLQSSNVDRATDVRLLEILQEPGTAVLDSLTAPLLKPAHVPVFCILLRAPLHIRAQRAQRAAHVHKPLAWFLKGVQHKDAVSAQILSNLWGIDILQPPEEAYDLVIDDTHLRHVLPQHASWRAGMSLKRVLVRAFVALYKSSRQEDQQRPIYVKRCRALTEEYALILPRVPISLLS